MFGGRIEISSKELSSCRDVDDFLRVRRSPMSCIAEGHASGVSPPSLEFSINACCPPARGEVVTGGPSLFAIEI